MKQSLKLGTHRKNKRVWLDNAKLLNDAGFKPGATYTANYRPISQLITLKLDPDGLRKVSKKTLKQYRHSMTSYDSPVIDLNSTKVGYALGDVKEIEVKYKSGLITIRGKS